MNQESETSPPPAQLSTFSLLSRKNEKASLYLDFRVLPRDFPDVSSVLVGMYECMCLYSYE